MSRGTGKHAAGRHSAAAAPRPSAFRIVAFAFALLATCAFLTGTFAMRWVSHTWATLNPDEIVYLLSSSIDGTDPKMILSAVTSVALPAIAAMGLLGLVAFSLRAKPRLQTTIVCAALVLSALVAGVSLKKFDEWSGLVTYIFSARAGDDSEDFIGAHYVNPKSVELEFPERKRNLVYIFLESMEMTYSDKASGGAFERSVIPELTALAQEGEDFSGSDPSLNGGIVLPGTGWTMGGMFAQSCGVPLKLPIDGNSMDTQESFFPGIAAIGDILAEQGYHQVLMLGSDATFGGRRLYYDEHGGLDIYDYIYASEQGFIPEGYKVFWGFEDERLFAWARQVLPSLAAAEEPFNLTMLTVDTHFEDGWVCDLCGNEFGDDQYANVMACSSRQVSEFVNWLSQQDFWENTTVIISGDHTTMDKDFCENVPGTYQRRTFVTVLNGAAQPEDPTARREYSTLDLFPTTLAAMGVKVQGDRLGLGTNLYGTRPTIVEEYGLDACRQALSGPSTFLAVQGKIVVSESYLAGVASMARLKADVSEDGSVTFILSDVKVDTSYVRGAQLRVVDDRTQEERVISMEVIPVEDNPRSFWCRAVTDYQREDLEHLHVTALITTNGCEDYPICEEFSIGEG